MTFNPDYACCDESSDSEAEVYARPQYLRKDRQPGRASAQDFQSMHRTKANEDFFDLADLAMTEKLLKIQPRKIKYVVDPAMRQDGIIKEKPQMNSANEKAFESCEKSFEYGDAINGFRFVGLNPEVKRFHEILGSNQKCPYDKVKFECLQEGNVERNITSFWSSASDVICAPLMGVYPLETVEIDDITKEGIITFYEESSKLLNEPVRELYRQQRIAWHPDKMLRRFQNPDAVVKAKITKIFQLINNLWEPK
ncbi:LAMI_0G14730g1_1 [Lachancea mirantina]|uniref:LAMI_0G14730g1_1 n=1 Tax=Lachancea mirantina TaxID=1230905 RepID=A0A1G4KCA5_9SACH|nr:LAMI_0G14730g1_1 [Lachancea mirantina]